MNRDTYEAAKKFYGLKASVWVNGKEFAQIPKDPAGLLFWAVDRIATPIFGDDGELRDWKVADIETQKKYKILVEEMAKINGYSFPCFTGEDHVA